MGYFSSACINQQIKTMGIIQQISYDKSRCCSISLDDAYFEHIYCETNTDNISYKLPSDRLSLFRVSVNHCCNISSSCDVVYRGRWLTQAGCWFILRFCEHFTCLSSKIQNAIKLENISNLITSGADPGFVVRGAWVGEGSW